MKWNGLPNYLASKKTIMKDPQNYVIGSFQHSGRFTGVEVNKAGHGGLCDQPYSYYDILNRMVDGNWE